MRSLGLAVILVVVSTAGRGTFRGSALLQHGIYPICWVSGGHRKMQKTSQLGDSSRHCSQYSKCACIIRFRFGKSYCKRVGEACTKAKDEFRRIASATTYSVVLLNHYNYAGSFKITASATNSRTTTYRILRLDHLSSSIFRY